MSSTSKFTIVKAIAFSSFLVLACWTLQVDEGLGFLSSSSVARLFFPVPDAPEVVHNNERKKFHQCIDQEWEDFPHHCHLMEYANTDAEQLSKELYDFSKTTGFVINEPSSPSSSSSPENNHNLVRTSTSRRNLESESNAASEFTLPSVLAHGMGDSCFNHGMQSMTSRVSKLTSQYATCIPIGDNQHEDTIHGYLLSMDASIDIFAKKVKADPKLQKGFNAVGFSQGNNIIRGYIARYNDPPVNAFVSINGVNAGTGAVPYCMPSVQESESQPVSLSSFSYEKSYSHLKNSMICNALMEIASNRAYSEFAQQHSFQANYWRDPRNSAKDKYRKYSQLAQLNNEGFVVNATLNDNYAKTNHFVWVMATKDKMVWPREGEHWGAPNPEKDPFSDPILPMNETEWYLKDLFGLKTADENGKNHFESFVGNHLRFAMDDFEGWIKKYFSL